MTEPRNRTRPTTAALSPIYEVKNPVTGDQFIIYAADDAGMFTVAHVIAPLAAPRIHLVNPDDIAEYATGAVGVMRNRHAGFAAQVYTNSAPAPLSTRLPD
ncbi:hypothetical protein [Nocardia abscessus]|uniref:hypothetical protein n=1 Tax=Nocardia abscessus TaxID=120957 RepID=UPI002458FD89|nr:hypothetical protein [Nocardia abscessus]